MKKKTVIIFPFSIVVTAIVPLLFILDIFFGLLSNGNAKKYSVRKTKTLNTSPIKNNLYYFLGSSVTLGSASYNESMADFIGKRNDARIIKDAVSGTLLADIDKKSYLKRLESFDKSVTPTAFIIQLSTNDTPYKNKGEISKSFTLSDFNKATTYGAIEYIIAIIKKTWNCPIVFYTNPYYDNAEYALMVEALLQIAKKWEITVLDLYSDSEFNNISNAHRKLFMNDSVHPTRAGYKNWWTPKFESLLYKL